MNIAKRLTRKFSLFINKITGGTVQNVNTGGSFGEAFPGMSEAARRAAADGSVLLLNDGTLPLSHSCKVALFGRVQLDTARAGTYAPPTSSLPCKG